MTHRHDVARQRYAELNFPLDKNLKSYMKDESNPNLLESVRNMSLTSRADNYTKLSRLAVPGSSTNDGNPEGYLSGTWQLTNPRTDQFSKADCESMINSKNDFGMFINTSESSGKLWATTTQDLSSRRAGSLGGDSLASSALPPDSSNRMARRRATQN